MNTILPNSLTIEVPAATPGRHLIGDQPQLRGKKILAVLAAGVGSSRAPSGAPATAAQDVYLSLVSAAGRVIHENLPLRALQDALVGGQLFGLGREAVDWSKSYVVTTAVASPNLVAALVIIYE